jgi:hypothetical protein
VMNVYDGLMPRSFNGPHRMFWSMSAESKALDGLSRYRMSGQAVCGIVLLLCTLTIPSLFNGQFGSEAKKKNHCISSSQLMI